MPPDTNPSSAACGTGAGGESSPSSSSMGNNSNPSEPSEAIGNSTGTGGLSATPGPESAKCVPIFQFSTDREGSLYPASQQLNTATLSERFLSFFNSGVHSDVTLAVGNEKIRAHKVVLMMASPYFEDVFTKNLFPPQEIEVGGVEPVAFRLFLQFLYSGVYPTNDQDALPLLHCATQFKVPCLATAASKLLETTISLESALSVLEHALTYNCVDLQEVVLKFICQNAYKLLDIPEFGKLSADALELIIARDDLRAYSEIQVFEAVIRWAIPQYDSKMWFGQISSESEMRNILKPYLKAIRYPQMNKLEFTKQCQFLHVLESDQVLDILRCFDLPFDKRSNFHSEFVAKTRSYYIANEPIQMLKWAVKPEGSTDYELINAKTSIKFKSDRPVWIANVYLAPWYQQNRKLTVKLKLKIVNSSSNQMITIAAAKQEVITKSTKCPMISFNQPIRLNPQQWYTVSVQVLKVSQSDAYRVFSCNKIGNEFVLSNGDNATTITFAHDSQGFQIPEIGFMVELATAGTSDNSERLENCEPIKDQ